MAHAQIIKVIWRLDFNVSYTYLDKRGSALNALSNTVPNFWEIVGDGTVHLSYVGSTTKNDINRTISLEPTSLNGDIEWLAGTALDRFLSDESFRGIDRIVRELLKVCEIRSLGRAGLRLFCVSRFADGKRERERTLVLLDKNIKTVANESLGPINDVGFILEGNTADRIGYKVTFGPFDQKNVLMSLRAKPSADNLKLLNEADLFFDVDLFESNFSFAEHSLFRWSQTKVERAIDFIAQQSGDPPKDKKDGSRRKVG